MYTVQIKTPFEFKKKIIDLWEFLNVILEKYEEVEEYNLGLLIKQWEKSWNISKKEFNKFIKNKISWK